MPGMQLIQRSVMGVISTTTSTTTVHAYTMTDDPKKPASAHLQDVFVGGALAIGGNIIISISLNLQKYAHVKITDSNKHYTKEPLWWLGLCLMILGEIGNFSAYGFAPASLVAPLGSTTVIANMFIAAAFLKEKIKPEHLFGCALAIIGAFLIVAFSNNSEKVLSGQDMQKYMAESVFIIYICLELVALGVLLFLLYHRKMKFVVIYLLIAAVMASVTVISAKGVSSMLQLTFTGSPQWKYPIFYIMIVLMLATAIVQVKYLNMAMKLFDATVVVPTHFVFFTISAIVAGIIFYKEFWGMGGLDIAMFLFGCLMCFVGVYFVTAGRSSSTIPKTPKPDDRVADIDIFPSWLFATVNMAPVQPKREIGTLYRQYSDTLPILHDQGSSHSSLNTVSEEQEQFIKSTVSSSSSRSYGATNREVEAQIEQQHPSIQQNDMDSANDRAHYEPREQVNSPFTDSGGLQRSSSHVEHALTNSGSDAIKFVKDNTEKSVSEKTGTKILVH